MNNKLIIVEGAQGVGKGTITNILREKMPYTNLLRLSGINDKSIYGKNKVFNIRESELDMIYKNAGKSINYILDRSYLTEAVFCRLGYKDYNFLEEEIYFNEKLNSISYLYDTYIVLLLATEKEFEKRLKRDKPNYIDVQFSVDNSIKQQEMYLSVIKNLSQVYTNINYLYIHTDNISPSHIVKNIFNAMQN